MIRMHLGTCFYLLMHLLLTVCITDHCIEMIRQNTMCNADLKMITWDWVEGLHDAYPNFNTRHQCRDYEKILDWAVKHAVHIDKSEVTRSKDTIDMPLPFNPKDHGL